MKKHRFVIALIGLSLFAVEQHCCRRYDASQYRSAGYPIHVEWQGASHLQPGAHLSNEKHRRSL